MPTQDASATLDRISRRALGRLGNHRPTTAQLSRAKETLDLKIKEIDPDGKWLWTTSLTESTLTVSSGTQTYSTGVAANQIASDILQLSKAWYLIGDQHHPIRILSHEEAESTYLKDDTGQPFAIYLERRPLMSDQKLWVYPTPNGTWTIKYTYQRRIYDFDSQSQLPDFPQGWELTLEYGLAFEEADSYGTPADKKLELKSEFLERLQKRRAQNADKYKSPTLKTVYY